MAPLQPLKDLLILECLHFISGDLVSYQAYGSAFSLRNLELTVFNPKHLSVVSRVILIQRELEFLEPSPLIGLDLDYLSILLIAFLPVAWLCILGFLF